MTSSPNPAPSRRIGVIVGSLRRESINARLAGAIEALLPKHYEARRIAIGEIPLYNQDHDADLPAPVRAMKAAIEACDALIIATPEYDRSIPGVLKNAIDSGSRPWGRSSWKGRPVGIVGASPGMTGTAMAQQHLRNVLAWADMPTLNQPEFYLQVKDGTFDADGAFGAETAKFARTWVDAFVAHVERHVGAKAAA